MSLYDAERDIAYGEEYYDEDDGWDDEDEYREARREGSLWHLTQESYHAPMELLKPFRDVAGEDVMLVVEESGDYTYHCQVRVKADKPYGVRSTLATWYMTPFAGLCAAVIIHGGFIYGPHRRKGLGHAAMALKKKLAYDAGYSIVVASDICNSDSPQGKIFAQHDFKRVFEGLNDRTDNLCGIYASFIGDG